MAFGKKKDGSIRCPSRILLVLLTLLVIPFAVVLAISATVARPYFAPLNAFVLQPNYSTEENRAEPRAIGAGGLYAPACNIHRSPFAGRNYEYVSEDGFLSGAVVEAEIRGIQSQGVHTYLKHFALNDQETHRDNGGLVTWANEQAMREVYLKPFEMGVKLGRTMGIMSSFNRIGAVPAAESYALLTEVLRDEWGFEGCVITDCVMAANSEATFDVQTFQPYPVQLALCGICAAAIALYAWYLVRRHKKMVTWRKQEAA